MSTLFVTQYCHVHFHGGGVVVLNEYYAFARWRYFTTTTRILFVFSFHVFFLKLVIPARSKVLIYTTKRNPEDSGRSSKMVSSCQWPFSSFLLASSLLNSSFYFNHSGTLQSSAVVSYDIMNIDKKLNLFALREKIEFGLCKKMENFVINKT